MRQIKISPSITERSKIAEDYFREIDKVPLLSQEDETELSFRIQQGDQQALTRLVESNLRFVVTVAKLYQNRGLPLMDLISEGNMGLIKAATRFDPTRGFKFISYAVWWIRQQILQALNESGRIIRIPMNKAGLMAKASKASNAFIQENEREPTAEELAELMNLEDEDLKAVMQSGYKCVSLDDPLGDEDSETLESKIPDNKIAKVDSRLEAESLKKDLFKAMAPLSERERDVLKLTFGLDCKPMTLEEVGNTMNLTRERVRQLKNKAIRKIGRSSSRELLLKYL